ncbi:hypothetical protein BsIDN1_29190 [Bacillus safensis]|uniref:30S ribosomal protein S16 n=1 Tax=Bacillus safensis TaxID=561879 RepID=A0A5S9M8S3_BACIA|nr:hypothetical protein BsIDN1_29190 [Bacillus safensis]
MTVVSLKQLELTTQWYHPAEVKINEELALKWLQNGAKPSDTVRNLFSSQGILEKFHNAKNSK